MSVPGEEEGPDSWVRGEGCCVMLASSSPPRFSARSTRLELGRTAGGGFRPFCSPSILEPSPFPWVDMVMMRRLFRGLDAPVPASRLPPFPGKGVLQWVNRDNEIADEKGREWIATRWPLLFTDKVRRGCVAISTLHDADPKLTISEEGPHQHMGRPAVLGEKCGWQGNVETWHWKLSRGLLLWPGVSPPSPTQR